MSTPAQPGRQSLLGSLLERRYRVDSLIARGGMSTVYRGLDTRLDRPVAIKVMDAQYSGDRSFISRFEDEARLAAKLHHPDIVAVYDQGVDRQPDGDHIFLVMQLVEGATLRDLIYQDRRLSIPMAFSVIEHVLSGIAAAHQAGMVHRDIKPENVLIGHGGAVKVADFGLVRAAASAGRTSGSVILGTVAYLSPEQVTTGAADARTDVYAAGVVLYEMLTGEPPYVGDTALSVAYRHVNDDVPPPSGRRPEVPPEIDELVVRATRRDPGVRPSDAAAFLDEVRRVRDRLGIEQVTVPVPVTEEQSTARIAASDLDGPPTTEIPAVGAAPQHAEGPRGTMALSRGQIEPERPAAAATPLDAGMRALEHSEPAPRRGQRRALWVLLVAALIGLVAGTAWWLGSTSSVAIPQVEGTPETAAIEALRAAELTPTVVREVHDTVPEGTVISSSPSQGTEVSTGDTVELVVSNGRPQVPSISAGSTVDEAESKLRDAKLQPQRDSSVDQYHPSIPEGRVLGVDPAAGTALKISSPVTIIVSKGPEPVPVPDVTGLSKDDAWATLTEAGFEPFEAAREFSSDIEADHVISTDPSAGTEVKLKGRPRIGVVLSNAVTVPSLTGKQVSEAQQIVESLGLTLQVQSWFDRPNSVVLGQFPIADQKVEPGSTVHVTAF